MFARGSDRIRRASLGPHLRKVLFTTSCTWLASRHPVRKTRRRRRGRGCVFSHNSYRLEWQIAVRRGACMDDDKTGRNLRANSRRRDLEGSPRLSDTSRHAHKISIAKWIPCNSGHNFAAATFHGSLVILTSARRSDMWVPERDEWDDGVCCLLLTLFDADMSVFPKDHFLGTLTSRWFRFTWPLCPSNYCLWIGTLHTSFFCT